MSIFRDGIVGMIWIHLALTQKLAQEWKFANHIYNTQDRLA